MLCLGCDKEYRLLNKDMNIHVRPEQEVQLTYPSYLNAIYFYCVECRKTVKTQGISDENLAEYLIHREVREVLETLPSSSERKTFEAQTLAETVKEEREIHADAMKAMDRWYAREYKDLKEDWKRKDLRIRELEEENRSLKRQLEVKEVIETKAKAPKINALRLPSFVDILGILAILSGIQYR